ncbi:hypothetical protein ILYODFUR_035691 [Ilyodon furcidens]|uniref:Uncharacterized protein n=1 Tax=Ilyodon furcidens TaxID=33524 RepID=A0ABV0UB43_9TELE
MGSEGLCGSAEWSAAVPLCYEPEATKSSRAMKNIMSGPSANPKGLHGYRPIALTSHIMKVRERLVLVHLRTRVLFLSVEAAVRNQASLVFLCLAVTFSG